MTQANAEGAPEDDPPSTDPAPRQRCPRCGGAAVPRKAGRRSNPFLTANQVGANLLTCVDCGLDFTPRAGP